MKIAAVVAAVVLMAPAVAAAPQATPAVHSVELAYDLDFDGALASARQAVAARPRDPEAHLALASVLWVRMLFLRGGLTVDEYLGPPSLDDVSRTPPPAASAGELGTAIDTAVALAGATLRARPNDVDALYAMGVAAGRQAAYIATEEGKLLRAFFAARRAYDAHQRVLELAPYRVDAGLVVGTYRYLVAMMSRLLRWVAYLAGFGGDKALAFQLMETCAERSATPAGTEARFGLVIMYNREGRYDEALRQLQFLRDRYPNNRLLWLETGATTLRAGRPSEALAWLNEGLGRMVNDPRPRSTGEMATWRLKRGRAHAELGNASRAGADARAAAAEPASRWVRGRVATLEGQVADLEGRRADALVAYRRAVELCRSGNDPVGVQEARRWIDNAFRGTSAAPSRQYK